MKEALMGEYKGTEKEISDLSSYLCNNLDEFYPSALRHRPELLLPSRTDVIEFTELARAVLFPGFFGSDGVTAKSISFHVASCIDKMTYKLREQIRRGFCFGSDEHTMDCSSCERSADQISHKFISLLPSIQNLLLLDSKAAYQGDPSATSINECIYSYPGLLAVTNYRIAHELQLMKVPIIPRIITEYAHSITGIDIHPSAKIGKSFFIDHGTGVVIGETCVIGNNVRLYQGVTLGAKKFDQDEDGVLLKGILRHPTLEDDVVVYAGANILGPIRVGRGSVIGGNVWLTHDVPSGAIITMNHG